MPAALLVVALSVLLSRLTGIPTAFLFGLVVSIVWSHRQTIRQSGALALMLMGLTIAVGVGSFLVYSELHHSHDEGFWHELWLEVFAGLSLESLATLLIALLPLKILDGRRIFSWSRLAWIAIYFVALMAFVLVVTPVAHDHGFLEAPPWGWMIAFAAFSVIAVIVVGPVPRIPGPRRRRRRVRRGLRHPSQKTQKRSRRRRRDDHEDERHAECEQARGEQHRRHPGVEHDRSLLADRLNHDQRREQRHGQQVRDASRRGSFEQRRRHEIADELEREHDHRREQHDVPDGHAFAFPSQLVSPTTTATAAAASTGTPLGTHGMSTAATTAAPTATAIG